MTDTCYLWLLYQVEQGSKAGQPVADVLAYQVCHASWF